MKLFLAGAVILLITAAAVALLGYRQARHAILAEAKRHVLGIVLERRARLEQWMMGREEALDASVRSLNHDLPGHHPPPLSHAELLRSLVELDPSGELVDQEIVDPGSADVSPEHAAAARAALAAGRAAFGPIHLHGSRSPVISLAYPLRGRSAVLVQDLRASTTVDPVLSDTTGLGKSGEVFLIGPDLVMLTPSRFHNHPQPLTHKMPIPPVYPALKGSTGVMVYKGFLGQEVVGAYTYLPEMKWAVIGEMNIEEAYAPLHEIMVRTIIAAAVALLILLGATMILARTWIRPLEKMSGASSRVARGDYSATVPAGRRRDEIGQLVQHFNAMVEALDHQRHSLQKQQARLVQSERMAAIGALVASIVHEMRNPLSSVKMNLRLLERRTGAESVEAEHLALASGEVERLETMFSELLAYSKPAVLKHELLDPAKVLQRAAEQVSDQASTSGVDLAVTLPEDPLPGMQGDEEQLLRTLVNLASNAIQACDAGGKVELAAHLLEDHRVAFDVRDNGRGMSESVRERVFDPFFTTREDGVGLGMSNVRKFVEAAEGTLDIESTEGEGTLIRMTLPRERDDGDAAGN